MKRMFYISRFSRLFSKRDIEQIHSSAVRFNRQHGITGILVGIVALTFLSQNIEVSQNACCWISTTYKISIPIKKAKSAD
jgi:hypothetical protein